jgi:hypothetical protein
MGKRAIGIDVSTHHVRAVQMVREGEQLHVEKVFCAPTRRSTDSSHDLIHSLWHQRGFDPKAEVAAALPHHCVFYRDLRLNAEDLDRLHQGGGETLEHHFPIASGHILTHICTERLLEDDRYLVLLAATEHRSLEERTQLFAHCDSSPQLLDVELCAVQASVWANYPESRLGSNMVAYLDETHLALGILEDGLPLLIRNTPLQLKTNLENDQDESWVANLVAQEARLTWQKSHGHELERDITIYLCYGSTFSDALRQEIERQAACTVEIVDPSARVAYLPGQSKDVDLALAQGLAIRALTPKQTAGVNFLASKQSRGMDALDLRQELRTVGGLVAGLLVAWLIAFLAHYFALEHRYTEAKEAIDAAFKQYLPNIPVVQPAAQLEQTFGETLDEYQQLVRMTGEHQDPLRILQNLGDSKPAQSDAVITDLLITSDTIRVTGSCGTFEQAHQWQVQMESIPGWERTRLQDPRREGPNGRVRFTLLIDTAKEAP